MGVGGGGQEAVKKSIPAYGGGGGGAGGCEEKYPNSPCTDIIAAYEPSFQHIV